MTNTFQRISEINSSKSSWSLKAKVIRLWTVSDFNRNTLPFSVEMVLIDSEGDRIHASIRKTLLYKFQNDVVEGKSYAFENLDVASNGGSYKTTKHSYKLNFQYGTKVMPLAGSTISGSPFNFIPISDISGANFDSDYLVDVIGMLTGVGTEREYDRNGKSTKLNVIALDQDGHKIQCTLFGSYVDDLNTFMASGETQNAVVAVQFGKVKTFQDKLHIQNCINATKVFFNPTCAEAMNLRERMVANIDTPSPLTLSQIAAHQTVDPLQDFMFNTPRSTIQGLKDCSQDAIFVVLGTIKHIVNTENWFYTACICNKSVYPDSRMYFCEKCNKHVVNVFRRYSIKVRVMDDTANAVFVIFDRDATLLFNRSCADMLQTVAGAAEGAVPPEISGLVNRTFLFKVECKTAFSPRFEQSFRVRKICTDDVIINQFKAKWAHEEAIFLKNANEMTSLSGLLDNGGKGKGKVGCSTDVLTQSLDTLTATSFKGKEVVADTTKLCLSQNLLPKFSDVVDLDQLDSPSELPPLSAAAVEKAIGKRVSPNEPKEDDDNLPIKLLKRSIKIEKLG